MFFILSDAILSVILLFLGTIHLGLSQMPVIKWIIGGIIYSFIFRFTAMYHRALPRLIIIAWLFAEDYIQNIYLGSSALSVLIAIEVVRLCIKVTGGFYRLNNTFDAVLFNIFLLISNIIHDLLACFLNNTEFQFTRFAIISVIGLCMHILFQETWLKLYTNLYSYHKKFSL